jgi:hypothetical protein
LNQQREWHYLPPTSANHTNEEDTAEQVCAEPC